MRPEKSFEETYRRYPFAPLVDLSLALGRLLVRARDKRAARRSRRAPRGALSA